MVGTQQLVSRPDFVVTNPKDEIVATALEAKLKANVYQLAGEALSVSLHNYMKTTKSIPIALMQLQKSSLSAGSIYFPPEYLDSFLNGQIAPTSAPEFTMFTLPRQVRVDHTGHNTIVGADFRTPKERELAVRMLAQTKALSVIMGA